MEIEHCINRITDSIIQEINLLRRTDRRLLIAVDGRCAAGKTTLAAHLQSALGCNVIPMDHFFLRPEQRTAERLSRPGGNVDCERFLTEVLLPLSRGDAFSYRPFDCWTLEFSEAIYIEPRSVNVIEGSYCCHPALFPHYGLKIFLTVDPAEQLRRIRQRNGEIAAAAFAEKWIPMEERYFAAYHIKERCDLCYDTDRSVE